MPIGKSSIEKRVAKTDVEKKKQAPELVATTAAAPAKKAPAKNPVAEKASTTATKTATAKKAPAKKAAPKAEKSAVVTKTKVDTTVIANVSPETVEKVTGHKEKDGFEKIQLGGKLPTHLL